MSARILVVDDVPANVKLLEARLSAEYFDVLTASNGTEALEICSRAECAIILLEMRGQGRLCRQIEKEVVRQVFGTDGLVVGHGQGHA